MGFFGLFARKKDSPAKALKMHAKALRYLNQPNKRMYHLEFTLDDGLKACGATPADNLREAYRDMSLLLAAVYLQYAQNYCGLELDKGIQAS